MISHAMYSIHCLLFTSYDEVFLYCSILTHVANKNQSQDYINLILIYYSIELTIDKRVPHHRTADRIRGGSISK